MKKIGAIIFFVILFGGLLAFFNESFKQKQLEAEIKEALDPAVHFGKEQCVYGESLLFDGLIAQKSENWFLFLPQGGREELEVFLSHKTLFLKFENDSSGEVKGQEKISFQDLKEGDLVFLVAMREPTSQKITAFVLKKPSTDHP
jgi:hypothetical protein